MADSAFGPLDPDSVAAAGAAVGRLAPRTAVEGPWFSGSFAVLARAGVLAAFVPPDAGGTGASETMRLVALTAIAGECLTTALALSQWAAAIRIIAQADAGLRQSLLPPLARGEGFTTVGISQLTTSRQHAGTPAVRGARQDSGWRLDGQCPWVTGADCCRTIVTGAATPAGGQSFFVIATDRPGVEIGPPLPLLALAGSRTAVVRLDGVRPLGEIAPPTGGAARSGGLATTALALGSARAAARLLAGEAMHRPEVASAAARFHGETEALAKRLHAAAAGSPDTAERDRLRADANSLVLRAAQAALSAAKGAGFVAGHPAERLARESLFFLVWSCPQAVTAAALCELTGLSSLPN